MKIGYFVSGFPHIDLLTRESIAPHSGGGVGVVAYNLAVEMANRGHKISIFTTSKDRENLVEKHGNLKIYRYKKSFKVGNAQMPLSLLYSSFKDINLDIVHVHLGNLPAPLKGYWYAKKRNKPFIITYHEDYIGGFGSLARRVGCFIFNHYFADKLLSFADHILTPSQYYISQSKFLKKYKNKVKNIPNGINLEKFHIHYSKEESRNRLNLPPNKELILFVGSLTPRKSPHILLTAMEKVVKSNPNSMLLIVGDGSMKNKLHGMVSKLDIKHKVRFTGAVDENTKLLYYKSSDLFVLPSISEGFGIVLLEASAFNLPLIVSNLEVFKTIVESGRNGMFCKTGDADDLAKNIQLLLNNKNVIKKMGRYAKEKVKEFDWKKIANETEKVYLNLLRETYEPN